MYCTVDDWSVCMSVQYTCAWQCGGRPLTSHILLYCVCMLWYCFREEALATSYIYIYCSYTKKVWFLFYDYAAIYYYYVANITHLICSTVVVEEYTMQLATKGQSLINLPGNI